MQKLVRVKIKGVIDMKENITIRFAEASDVDLILNFIKELAEYEKLLDEVIATPETLKKSLFGSTPFAKVIFAYLNEEPVGFALFFNNYSTFLGKPGVYIEDLYVKPHVRGKGVGRILLSFLATYAKEMDCGRLEWWVLDWNKIAIQFYEKIGAEPMSDWTVYRLAGNALDELSKL